MYTATNSRMPNRWLRASSRGTCEPMSMKGLWGDMLRRRVDLQEAADKTVTVFPRLRRPASRKTACLASRVPWAALSNPNPTCRRGVLTSGLPLLLCHPQSDPVQMG
jgi:hypothetical protein